MIALFEHAVHSNISELLPQTRRSREAASRARRR
jgi:hypothetical protein